MKKALLVIGVILVALSIMAPGPPDKAEKLRVDNEGWDANPANNSLSVPLLCKFGIATAGEHADFYVEVNVTVTNESGSLEVVASGKDDIVKVDNNHWDYVKIEPAILDIVSWNGDDDGSEIVASGTVDLIGPSGNPISTTIVENQVITGNFGCGAVGCPES